MPSLMRTRENNRVQLAVPGALIPANRITGYHTKSSTIVPVRVTASEVSAEAAGSTEGTRVNVTLATESTPADVADGLVEVLYPI